jgi:hypothetical protein
MYPYYSYASMGAFIFISGWEFAGKHRRIEKQLQAAQ